MSRSDRRSLDIIDIIVNSFGESTKYTKTVTMFVSGLVVPDCERGWSMRSWLIESQNP